MGEAAREPPATAKERSAEGRLRSAEETSYVAEQLERKERFPLNDWGS